MALYIGGKPLVDPANVLHDLASFMKMYPSSFEPGSSKLKAKEVATVSDCDVTLYVNQREYAIISGDGSSTITALGSDMATTCHIVVIYHKDTKMTALGHFDGASTKQGVNDMLNEMVAEVISRLDAKDTDVVDFDLHVVGGFCDGRCLSERLSLELLNEFYHYESKDGSKSVRIHLDTFCASSLNNVTLENCDDKFLCETIHSPVIFGIVCDAKTGELSPAVFEENAKLPVSDVRSARSLMGVKFMPNIYRIHDGSFVLNPFTYGTFEQIEIWLEQPDHIIRKYMSTSPEVEPDNFCDHIRASLKFIYNNPDPLRSVFRNEKALVFKAKVVDGRLTWDAI